MFGLGQLLSVSGIILGFTTTATAAFGQDSKFETPTKTVILLCNSAETIQNLKIVPKFTLMILGNEGVASSGQLVEPNNSFGAKHTHFSIGKQRLHSDIFVDLLADDGFDLSQSKLTIPIKKHLGIQSGVLKINIGRADELSVDLGCIQL